MYFQTPITVKSAAVKLLKKKIKEHRDILESPFKVLEMASIDYSVLKKNLLMQSFNEYQKKLTIELNDFEKAIDLITKNTYD